MPYSAALMRMLQSRHPTTARRQRCEPTRPSIRRRLAAPTAPRPAVHPAGVFGAHHIPLGSWSSRLSPLRASASEGSPEGNKKKKDKKTGDKDFEWRAAELDELSAMMPDPEDDIFDLDAPNSEYQQLLAMGMSDNSDFDDIMDEYLTLMERRESQAEDARPADDWMVEAGARVHVDGDDMAAVKEQMAINNFHCAAAYKDAIVRDRTEDCIYFNILNFQRAHNRFKMCKEIGRWVEFFEEQSGENYAAVMTVPSWIKAVMMVNYEFQEYNEEHRLEDLEAVEDDEYEESIDLEHFKGESGGVFDHNFDWENPPLQILGKEHLTPETGYPKAAIDEANRMAADLLYWQGSSMHMGYYRKDILPEYLKFQPIPSHLSELTDRELTEELGVVMDNPHPLNERLQLVPGWHTFIPSGKPGYYEPEKEVKKTMKTLEERRMGAMAPEEPEDRVYIMPEEEIPADDKIDLLWKALVPEEREIKETKLMGDILGKAAAAAPPPQEPGEEGEDDFDLYDEDFEMKDLEDDETGDGLDFELE
eukprot:CAMPEP_0177793318 /NCGR_PEP_ID=MMETSP0491_2-20121128/25008_1 /TAXON_ID=63592 /ORGANISM="Tetraselmis chuii, Strain PLY429" /LENGTH=533 /DNA_ID=CAMNT_0019315819 /DNA_START=313 /DNA_END=1914 /DNA_ORIENTATION=+